MTEWPSDPVTEWPNDWVTGWQEASQTIDRIVYFVSTHNEMMLSCRKRYRSFTVSSCCCYNPVLSDITGALSDVLNWRRGTERGRAEAERRGVDWDKAGRHRVILHCTVLYCTVLYCTVLYCTVLYFTVLYCTVLYCTVLLGKWAELQSSRRPDCHLLLQSGFPGGC